MNSCKYVTIVGNHWYPVMPRVVREGVEGMERNHICSTPLDLRRRRFLRNSAAACFSPTTKVFRMGLDNDTEECLLDDFHEQDELLETSSDEDDSDESSDESDDSSEEDSGDSSEDDSDEDSDGTSEERVAEEAAVMEKTSKPGTLVQDMFCRIDDVQTRLLTLFPRPLPYTGPSELELELQAMKDQAANAEKERQKNLMVRMLRRLDNRVVTAAWHTWQEHLSNLRKIAKMSMRMKHGWVVITFNALKDHWDEAVVAREHAAEMARVREMEEKERQIMLEQARKEQELHVQRVREEYARPPMDDKGVQTLGEGTATQTTPRDWAEGVAEEVSAIAVDDKGSVAGEKQAGGEKGNGTDMLASPRSVDSLEDLKRERLPADAEHEAVLNIDLEKANGSSEHAQLHPRAKPANGIAEKARHIESYGMTSVTGAQLEEFSVDSLDGIKNGSGQRDLKRHEDLYTFTKNSRPLSHGTHLIPMSLADRDYEGVGGLAAHPTHEQEKSLFERLGEERHKKLIDEAVNTLMKGADGQIRAPLSPRIKFPNEAAAAWTEEGSLKVAWP